MREDRDGEEARSRDGMSLNICGQLSSNRDFGRDVKYMESGEECQECFVNGTSKSERLYKTVVRPAILYVLETVALTRRQETELDVTKLMMLRFLLGVSRIERIRNEYTSRTAQVKWFGDKAREVRL